MKLRLATRRSPLALWQANEVARLLRRAHPDVDVDLVPTTTTADERLDLTIAELGGKGAFATRVQALVLSGRADAAVHSAKDLPAATVDGLTLAAVPDRGNPLDVLVGRSLAELAPGAVVRTGSRRRRVQLRAVRPDLCFEELRGNIATRLRLIPDDGAIVMAAAALERLALPDLPVHILPVDVMVPQVGQGTLAVEARRDDRATIGLLRAIEHGPSRLRLDLERAFLEELGGDCDLPAGAYATLDGEGAMATVTGVLADRNEISTVVRSVAGPADPRLGRRLAGELRRALEG